MNQSRIIHQFLFNFRQSLKFNIKFKNSAIFFRWDNSNFHSFYLDQRLSCSWRDQSCWRRGWRQSSWCDPPPPDSRGWRQLPSRRRDHLQPRQPNNRILDYTSQSNHPPTKLVVTIRYLNCSMNLKCHFMLMDFLVTSFVRLEKFV